MSTMFSLFLLHITNMCLVSGSLFNAALYKPAFMSSVFPSKSWTADKANDGNADVHVFDGYCAHSDSDNPGWWMVDLRGIYIIEQIVLVNRGDGIAGADRTKNYQFDVFETDPRSSPDFPMKSGQVCYKRVDPVGNGETFTQNCTNPVVGRFVRFIRYTYDQINICEIQVMVSYARYLENNFLVTKNSWLNSNSFLTTYADEPSTCTLLCSQRRDSDTCTAFNWVRTSNLCQLFKVNPRNMITLSNDPNTDFYVEG